jgi:hypothetical protein
VIENQLEMCPSTEKKKVEYLKSLSLWHGKQFFQKLHMRSPNYVSVHLQGNTKSSTPTRVPPEDADSCEIRLYLYFLKSFEGKVLQREVLDDSTSAETLYNPELKDSAY